MKSIVQVLEINLLSLLEEILCSPDDQKLISGVRGPSLHSNEMNQYQSSDSKSHRFTNWQLVK